MCAVSNSAGVRTSSRRGPCAGVEQLAQAGGVHGAGRWVGCGHVSSRRWRGGVPAGWRAVKRWSVAGERGSGGLYDDGQAGRGGAVVVVVDGDHLAAGAVSSDAAIEAR